jgi:8-oxo-dGTP pyrophosphatase MutT (NUDIX family)
LAPAGIVREFTVAVFVVHEGRVLLHWHRKLQRWLPPGGHIEPGELPDEAAVRETREETGLDVELVDAPVAEGTLAGADDEAAEIGSPRRLAQPIGIQLEDIGPGHQHIDLIYLARPAGGAPVVPAAPPDDPDSRPGWFAPEEWPATGFTVEVRRWATAALHYCATS